MDVVDLNNQIETLEKAIHLLITDAIGIEAKLKILKAQAKEQKGQAILAKILCEKYEQNGFEVS